MTNNMLLQSFYFLSLDILNGFEMYSKTYI